MSAKEYRLLRLLEAQFPAMAKSYAENVGAIAMAFDSGTASAIPSLHWYHDDEGRAFFRMNLDLPALFVLSEPVSRFQAYRQYIVPLDAERQYYADLALIPAYLGNLNRITCIDLYGEQAAAYFAPDSRPLRHGEEVFWRFDPSPTAPAQFSSLNFVLKWSSRENDLSPFMSEALARYFQYAFWVVPKTGFCSNAHVIHSRDNVRNILKVAKSLYVVNRIGDVHPERIAPYHTALVQKVELRAVNRAGRSFPLWTYLAKDVVERLQSGSETGRGNPLINGVIYEFKDKVSREGGGLSMLSVVADFLPTDFDLFMSLAGLAAAEMFEGDTFGDLGTIDDLRKVITDKYRLYAPRAEIEGTFFSKMDNPFEYLVDSLFPVLIKDKGRVYFVHPVVLSALLKLGLERVIEGKDSVTLAAFLRIVQMMRVQKPARLRFTEEADYFKGLRIDFATLLPVAYSCFCTMRISKMLSEFL